MAILLPLMLLAGNGTAYLGEVPETVAVTTPGSFTEAREPQVAIADTGSVYITYGMGDTIYCSVSNDGGRRYAAPIKVAEVGKLSLGMRRGPRIVAAGKTVVITAIYGQQGKGRDGELLSWRSTDSGSTWRGPVRVSDVPGAAREGLHAMAALGSGKLIACTWLDLREKGTQIYASYSRDGGATWDKNVRVYRSPDGTVCECCHPSAAFDASGGIIVMWRNALGGARDMYLARSANAGADFGPAQKLGQETWPLNACPMDGGALAVGADGAVTTFWRRDQQMFTCSPGGPEKRVGRGQQGWVAMGNSGTFLVWLEGRPGRLRLLTAGASEPQILSPLADDPVVAVSASRNGPVVAAWTVNQQGIRSAVLR